MKNKRFLLTGLAILTVFAMLACGGGGGGSDPAKVDITFNPDYTGGTSLVVNIVSGEALGAARFALVQAKQSRGPEWEFKGWVETQGGTTPVSVTASSSWTANKTYYGTWGEIVPAGEPVEITFNLNGFPDDTQQPEPKDATSGTAIGPGWLPVLSLPGYQWLGWSETTDGAVIGNTKVFNTPTTLYARYVEINTSATASINMASGALDADFSDTEKAAGTASVGASEIEGLTQYALSGLYAANDRNNLYVALEIPAGFSGFRYDRLVLLIDNTDSEDDTGGTPADPDTGGAAKPGEHADFAPFVVINENITGTVEARVYMRLIDWEEGPKGVSGASVNITEWNVGPATQYVHTPLNPSGGTGLPAALKFAIPLSEIANAAQGTELRIFAAFSMGWDQGPYPGSWAPVDAVTDFATAWKENAADVNMDIDMAQALSYTVKMSADPGNITLIYDMNGLPGVKIANKTIPSGVLGQAGLPVVAVDDIDFLGWSLTDDGAALSGTETFTANTVLYARWEESSNVVVRYDMNGLPGTAPANSVFPKETAIGTLPNPTYDNGVYTFLGWSRTSGQAGDIITTSEEFATSATLYARWHPVNITLTYNLGVFPANEAVPNPTSVAYNTAIGTSVLPTLTSSDAAYTFLGWATAPGGTLLDGNESFTANTDLYVLYSFTGPREFAAVNMSTGTLDADFNDAGKAVNTTAITTGGNAYTAFNGLYVANDEDYLYVALDVGSDFQAYENDHITLLIDNTASSAGGGTGSGAWNSVADTENITGSVEARAYLSMKDFLSSNGTGSPQGPWGVTGASHNITSVYAGSSDDDGWWWKFLAPAGGVLKFKIPLSSITGAGQGTTLRVFAAISMVWSNGSSANVGSYAPAAAASGTGTTVNIDMSNALSYTVK